MEAITKGSLEVLKDRGGFYDDGDGFVQGSSTGTGRRGRRSLYHSGSFNALSSSSADLKQMSDDKTTLVRMAKSMEGMKRGRRKRYRMLREVCREDDDEVKSLFHTQSGDIICPVCSKLVRGDEDVVDAHIDACLADEAKESEVVEVEAMWDGDVTGELLPSS